MKKTNKILLVVVLVLVVLFGVGQFFIGVNNAPITPANTAPAAPPAIPPVPTNVTQYVPDAPASSTPIVEGSCWTNSIAAPYRADAWRCTVGNSINDPCFAIPGSKNLLCGANPADPASTSTFVLKLTKPLPTAQALQGQVPNNWAWLVQLQDGTLCSPFTGTRPFTADGESADYACAPGPLGADILIFGDINASTSPWTATVGTLTENASSLPTLVSSSSVQVANVWQ